MMKMKPIKSIKKKAAALGAGLAMLASLAMSVSASAVSTVTYYDWNNDFTPYTGWIYASPVTAQVFGMEFTQSQVDFFKNQFSLGIVAKPSTEYEFRPLDYKPKDIWGEITFESSNLPSHYSEFDKDDVTAGCGAAKELVAGTNYYSRLSLTTQSNAPSSAEYEFESEYGERLFGVDAVPLRCSLYPYETPTLNNMLSW